MQFRNILLAVLTAGFVAGPMAAQASPILLGTTTNPTGINGLVVDSTTYNVAFSITTLNSFTSQSTLSLDSQTALVAALNSLDVVGLGGATEQVSFLVDLDNSLSAWEGPDCRASSQTGLCVAGTWVASEDGGGFTLGQIDDDLIYVVAADFSVAPPVTGVPEPITLSIFGAGLAGAAVMRRRRKAAKA